MSSAAKRHIVWAQQAIEEAERLPPDPEQIPVINLCLAYAQAHALVARALQEEERLDGCTRHHGQARPT